MIGWCETQDWINKMKKKKWKSLSQSAFKARVFDQPQPVHFSHDLILFHLPSSPLGSSFLSVGWPHLFICALYLRILQQLLEQHFRNTCCCCVCLSTDTHIFSEQPLLPSLRECTFDVDLWSLSIFLLLLCLPRHKSIYLYGSIYKWSFACCRKTIQAFFFFCFSCHPATYY